MEQPSNTEERESSATSAKQPLHRFMGLDIARRWHFRGPSRGQWIGDCCSGWNRWQPHAGLGNLHERRTEGHVSQRYLQVDTRRGHSGTRCGWFGDVSSRYDTGRSDSNQHPVRFLWAIGVGRGSKTQCIRLSRLWARTLGRRGMKPDFTRNGQERKVGRPPLEACAWNCPTTRSGC